MNWYLVVLNKYAQFSGRARRKEYWMFVLINLIISALLGFIIVTFAGTRAIIWHDLYSLAVLCPSIAVGVRRMHDSDHCGWWVLCPFYNIYLACIKGTQGENRFGPDPLQGG